MLVFDKKILTKSFSFFRAEKNEPSYVKNSQLIRKLTFYRLTPMKANMKEEGGRGEGGTPTYLPPLRGVYHEEKISTRLRLLR